VRTATDDLGLLLEHDNPTGNIGMGFKVAGNDADQYIKGAIIYQQTGVDGIGQLHFCLNAGSGASNLNISHAVVSLDHTNGIGILTAPVAGYAQVANGIARADSFAFTSGADLLGVKSNVLSGASFDFTVSRRGTFIITSTPGNNARAGLVAHNDTTVVILANAGGLVLGSSPAVGELGLEKTGNNTLRVHNGSTGTINASIYDFEALA
jgi:hypothetical protein